MVVNIALLSTLSSEKILANQNDLTDCFSNKVSLWILSISNFSPASRRLARSAIECFIQHYANTGVVAVVVDKFDQEQVVIPSTTKIQHAGTQHVLQCLNSPLKLAFCLWMIGSAERQTGAQSFLEVGQKLRYEMVIPIRHYRNWNTMESDYLSNIQSNKLTNRICGFRK